MSHHPVVAAVDGSAPSLDAARWAAEAAALRHTPLLLVNSLVLPTVYGSQMAVSPSVHSVLERDAHELLGRAAEAARAAHPGLEVDTSVVTGPVVPTLLNLSKDARLLVVGSRGLGAFSRGLLGSVSGSVARHAHCPVTVVHERGADHPDPDTRPVLVGVDGTGNSEAALAFAFEEASRRRVDLVAVHAWNDSSDMIVPWLDWTAMAPSEEAVLAESLAGWQEQYPDVQVRRVVVQDRPVRNLAERSGDAQLLVVGSHGRGGFAGMLLGSTSQALLHSATCPVTVVRGPH